MTTSLTEPETNHLIDSNLTVTEEERVNKQNVSLMAKDEERTINEEPKSSDQQLSNGTTEETNHQNALMQTSPSIVTNGDDEKEEQHELTTNSSALVNHDDDENRTKKSFESKTKFNSSSYRPAYYGNGLQYGPMQYYYYPQSNSVEKPTPLMFIHTPSPLGGQAQTSAHISSSVSTSSSRENQTGNSTTTTTSNSPPNLPPRLRQTSTTENENHSNAITGAIINGTTTNTTSTTHSSTSHPTTNGRRNRSIFPRGYPSFYAQHPPPPLMATPPGVLYPYPPVVHPTGPIAYNIRSTEDLEYFAYQQQFVPLPPAPLLWTPASQTGVPPTVSTPYPGYPMADLSGGYIYTNSTMIPPTITSLNPEAAEWIPTFLENNGESYETPIQLDDEISFPPLNSSAAATHAPVPSTVNNNAKDNRNEETNESILVSSTTTTEIPVENSVPKNDEEESTTVSDEQLSTSNVPSENKVENVTVSTSSQEQTTNSSLTKPTVVTTPMKTTPMPYSTVISQATDNQKSTKTNHQSGQTSSAARRAQPVKERPSKTVQPARGNLPPATAVVAAPTPAPVPQTNNNQRRQPVKTNTNGSRNVPSPQFNAPVKQQQQQTQPPPSPPVSDEWIEVKSKKTKKFDRFTNENSSEKISVEEPVHQTISPPSSLSSTGENTTTPFSSEDDFDEKDQPEIVVMIDNNNVTNDYNQLIIDDVHRKLDRHDRLVIIMRGCPGSGKSTLAQALNSGYNGVILSTDDFFTDKQTNEYQFDQKQLDEAHLHNRRRVADALKRNISPIIVDNTNTQAWEMKPYVAMAKEVSYDILIVEPQTPWRYKARELMKRNRHDLPLKRIKEMLNRFEHNLTVQNILEQFPLTNKTNHSSSISEQTNVPLSKDVVDPMFQSKKVYDIIDDSLILDDVRFCINDMILLLTSQIYQTALSSYTSILTNTTTTTTTTSQSSTPLSVSFHDLSLMSSSSTSLPSTPSTPHSRFHRQLTRFPSSTGQDYPFNSEHLLRLPNALPRCMDTINANQFSPVLSSQTSLLAKKRRKHKASPTPSPTGEPIYNTNNNNNNDVANEFVVKNYSNPLAMFNVILPEEFSDMVVVDETVEVAQPPQNSAKTLKSDDKPRDLLNILHHQLHQPSETVRTTLKCHLAIQCVEEEITDFSSNHSDRILKARSTNLSTSNTSTLVLPRVGFNDRGIQVDLDDSTVEQLNQLIQLYSTRASEETIRQFYNDCQSNLQWTQIRLDEHLEQRREVNRIPSLQHLALVALDRWDEELKSSNPTFDVNCLTDLLDDINDDEFQFDSTPIDENPVVLSDTNQIQISWSMINQFEDLYGELPNKSVFSSNNDGIFLPIDDDLSISIYQALQRRVIKSQETEQLTKPVNEMPIKNENKNVRMPKKITVEKTNNQQRWLAPQEKDQQMKKIPSLKQIIREEEHAAKCQKPKQKLQMDFASEHKFKQLERQFPSFDSNLLLDMFRDNEFNYDVTLVCVATLIDEEASISPKIVQSTRSPPISPSVRTTVVEPVHESYETLRSAAVEHVQRRKEFYTKAQQANRHGMAGVAAFYIHRASEETQQIKDANRVAGERLSRWRLQEFYQTHKLDLHGLHVDEALQLFKQIEEDFFEGNRRIKAKSIEIITGYGKNSVYGGGHAKIRPAIVRYLQQRNYKYSEPNRAVILVCLN